MNTVQRAATGWFTVQYCTVNLTKDTVKQYSSVHCEKHGH